MADVTTTTQAITEQDGAKSVGGQKLPASDPKTSTPAGDGKAPVPQED